jgi:hypothetical protein
VSVPGNRCQFYSCILALRVLMVSAAINKLLFICFSTSRLVRFLFWSGEELHDAGRTARRCR